MLWIYAFALAISPLIIWPWYKIDWAREPKEWFLLFVIIAMPIIWRVLRKNIFLGAFILWAIFGMWYRGVLIIHAQIVPKGIKPLPFFDCWVNVLAIFIIASGLWYLIVQRLNTKRLIQAICVGATIQAILGIVQYIFDWPTTRDHLMIGTLGNIGLYNNFIAICLPLFLMIGKKWMKWVGISISLLALILSGPASGFIGVGTVGILIGAIVFVWVTTSATERKIWMVVLLVCYLGCCVFFCRFTTEIAESLKARVSFWKDTIHYAQKVNPWVGWGIGNFKQVMPRAKTGQYTEIEGRLYEAHNEYIQTLFETGIIGLSIVALFIANIFRRFISILVYRRRVWGGSFLMILKFWDIIPLMISFIVILVVSCLSFPFHVPSTAFIAFTIIIILEQNLNETFKISK